MSTDRSETSASFRHDLAFWDVDSRKPDRRHTSLVFRPRIKPLVPVFERLLSAAWERRIPVVSTICVNEAFDDRSLRNDALLVSDEPHPDDDALEQRVTAHARIFLERHTCGSSLRNIEKRVFDVFNANPKAERVVRAVAAARWVVFGDSLGYCLRSTAEGLLRMGVAVTVLEDAAGRGIDTPERAREILSELAAAGAVLEQAEDVLSRLD